MKILISAPRTGSSWVYDGIAAHNLSLGGVEAVWPSELFSPLHNEHGRDIFEKIEWLEEKRRNGIEITFKHHINYLITPEYNLYTDWFRGFYVDHEVVLLKRRDTRAWFKSFLVQDLTNWQLAGYSANEFPIISDVLKYDPQKTIDRTIEQFFVIKNMLYTVRPDTTTYYEDQSDGYWATQSDRLSRDLDYDEFLNQHLDMDEVWESFEKCMSESLSNGDQ